MRLAAAGLFWSEVFDYCELDADVRERLVVLMEQMAREIAIEPEH